MFFAKQHHKKGFTLAETILVVAIIAILLAVAAPNVLAYYRQLKLTGLDDDAKTIFMAAQSRLTAMLSASEELEPKDTTHASPANSFGKGSYTETPAAGGAAGGAGDPTVNFWFVANDYSGLHNYVPAGSIETQLQNNKFVVEFNPDTGAVYAVWYWESDNDRFTYDPTYDEDAIDRDTRLDEMVGYYGGSEVKRPELGQLPIPQLNIINAEELRLEIRIPSITGESGNGYNNTNLKVDVFINGKAIIEDAQLSDVDVKDPHLRKDSVGKVILDTLKPGDYSQDPKDDDTSSGWSNGWVAGAKFKDWNTSKSIGAVPGDDIEVTVTVKYTASLSDGKQLIAQSASVSTNSLFASVKEDGGDKVAEIAYGRHLQNLDTTTSGVSNAITKAGQIRDINFASVNSDTYNITNPDPAKIANDIYYWGSTYPDLSENPDNGQDGFLNFHAINNNNLTAYDGQHDGQHYEIRNMHIVEEGGYGGLFALVSGGDYSNITVVNPHVHGEPAPAGSGTPGGSVGAIIGFAGGEVKIDGCKVYSEYDSTKDLPALEDWLKNKLDDEKIETTPTGDCYVSALLRVPHIECAESGSSAGGLVGQSAGNITINNSFSSIPVVGYTRAGGLVGAAGNISINNSYSASFVYGYGYVSGLVGFAGNLGDEIIIEDCYAAGEIMNGNPSSFIGAGLGSFHEGTTKEIENNYSAVKFVNASGEPKVELNANPKEGSIFGTFYGDDPSNNNYYIADPEITAGYNKYIDKNDNEIKTGNFGNPVSAAELVANFERNAEWTTAVAEMANAGTKLTDGDNTKFTHPYNLLDGMDLQVYPYPMLTTKIDVYENSGTTPTKTDLPMEHYGDWVVGASGEPAAAYIEMYTDSGSGDKRFGVYAAELHDAGTGTKGVSTVYNSLQDEVVLDDFYRFISPSVLTSATVALDNGTAGALELDTSFSADGKIKDVKGNEFYVYKLNNDPGLKNYYHKIEIVIGSETKTYLYNPSFACEAFDVTEYVADPAHTVNDTEKLPKPGYNEFVRTDVIVDHTEDVYIRSARQLANIQAYTQNTEPTISEVSQKWIYEQLADIDFVAYTGAGLTVGKDPAPGGNRLTPALLTSGEYDGHEYTISNLYIGKGSATEGAGLFERVGETTGTGPSHGKLDGMRLVNVNVYGGDATATGGLVGMLYGSVEDCGIYVKAEPGENITDIYKKWTIEGTGVNGVGGLIGQINGGTAKMSFASVRVDGTGGTGGVAGTGTGPVGGFVGQFQSGTVENCYSGGFVEEDTTGTRTYVHGSVNVTGNGSVGGFVGSVATDSAKFSGIDYSTASVGGPDNSKLGLFAGDNVYDVDKSAVMLNAVAKAFKATTAATGTTYTETAPRDESDYMGGTVTGSVPTEKQPYNQLSTTEFPFPSGQTVHHGDWIEVEAMGLYYDTVGTTTGYYANGKNVDSQTALATGAAGSGAVATDDGYMFVTEKDLGEKLSIKVGGKDFTMTRESISMKVTVDGIEKTYSYKYEVPAEALNTPTDNYYTAVSINGRIFYANFGAACEIFDDLKGDLNKPWAKSGIEYKDETGAVKNLGTGYTGVVVRSARQLANIGIRSNVGEYNALNTKVYTPAAEAIQTAAISQVLDIDYSKYDGTYKDAGGKDVTKIPVAAVLEGSKETPNHTPITINGGSYDGHSYEIRNLVPGMIRLAIPKSGSIEISEVLIQSGLVGRITKGEIKNVTLINATVVNDASKAVNGGGVGPTASEKLITSQGNGRGSSVVLNFSNFELVNQGTRPDGEYLNEVKPSAGHENDGCFTMLWTSDSKIANDKTWKQSSTTYTQYLKFAGAASTTNNSIRFTTSGPATVEIWWIQDNNTDRQMVILNSSGKQVAGTTQSGKGNSFKDTLTIDEAGTYYLGGSNGGNLIFRVSVTVSKDTIPVTASLLPSTYGPIMPIAADGENTFPTGVASDKFKARFGALVGAVNPAEKTVADYVKIENCGVYVEPEGLPAGDVAAWTDQQKKDAETKYNYDYKKYAVENSATSINDDAIGGLIGMATQGATIEDCFAAVKVTGVKSVGGFAGVLKNVTVEDCYSGGHTENGIYSSTDYNVTANGSDSFAGGFVGQMQVESSGNLIFKGVDYSTASAKGNTVGAFSGGTTLTGVTTWDGYDGVKELYAIGLVAGDKQNDETYLDDTMTIRPYTSNGSATPYDVVRLEDIYPYMTVDDGTGEHHGDWTLRFNFVYYELYKEKGDDVTIGSNTSPNRVFSIGNKLDPDAQYIGFYASYAADDGVGGIKTEVINTLRVDGDVYDSGYMIVGNAYVDKFPITILSRYLSSRELKWANGNRNDKEADDPGEDATGKPYTQDNPPPKYINVDAEQIFDFESLNNDVAKEIAEAVGQYGYAIPLQGQDVAASNEFYLEVFVNGQLYLYNPQFPCEVVNSDMAVEDSSGKWYVDTKTIRQKEGIDYITKNENGNDKELVLDDTVDGILIRSPWNLAGMARYSRPASTGLVSRDIVKQKFYQIMDVDYKEYNQNKISDANSSNRFFDGKDRINKAGTSWVFGQVPAFLTGGTYEGYNHTISNLYLSNDSSNNNCSGLFGKVTDGTIKDLRLDSIHVNTGSLADDKLTTDIGALAAVVEGNSTISNVHLSNIEIFLHKVPKVEKGDTSPNLKYSEPSNADEDNKSVAKVNSVGGAIGSLKGGTVEKVTVDGISIDLKNGATYKFKNSNKDLEINPTSDGKSWGSSMDSSSTPSVGGAIGEINCSESGASVSVSDLTVTDPTIKANRGKNDKVGGVIGSADGKTFDYSSTATGTDTRSVNITDTGVYMSETNKGKFNDMGVKASGDELSGDYSGGFAGYLGKGVNVTGDYAAIRVQGKTYAGGFAGQIEGSHVESCYSGGYLDPTSATPQYSTSDYNVEAKTAGGFAGKIDLARQSTNSPNMALYMKGHNYTTSSVKGTSTRGKFAGVLTNDDLEALNAKMGGDAPVLYAGGTVDRETNKLTGVKTGSAMPRGTNTFTPAPYYNGLSGQNFPYATDLEHHHGDWVEVDLNAVGYWEVEDGKVRVWYIPADAPDEPVEMLESGAAIGFDHDSRDAMGITGSGYFVVSSEKTTTFGITGMTALSNDTANRIKKLLGGDSVAIEVYALNDGKSNNQTWTFNGETFIVNPAYGMAIEHGATSTMGTSEAEAYQIRTVEQLENMGGVSGNVYFQQTHDIVCDSSFNSVTSFGGHFDGGFYRIIDNTKPVFASLADGAKVDNVIVYAPQGSTTINGNGGIANSSSGTVNISNTIVAGFTISDSGDVGGLVGEVTGGSLTIKNSEATNTLTGTGSNSNVGGLVGNVASGTLDIVRSYAGGSITRARSAGGLVGNMDSSATVKYENVYSYVNMMDASADTYYGIGLGDVNTDSDLSDYWATGLDKKTVKDTDANIKGVTLAEMKLHTQAMDKTDSSVTVEEYLKPDSTSRDNGLKNLAEGKSTDTEKFGVFPFAAFVTGNDTNYHYGDYPVAEYVGLYYYEKEVIFDAKNPMETNATTGKITNEDKARTEYNYYAYGGELFDADGDGTSEIYGQRVLDTLCYDHHLTGEYAYIAESGYGYFYPGKEGTFTATVTDFAEKTEITDKNWEILNSVDPIRDNLLKKLGVAGTENFQVYKLNTTSGPRTETWTVKANEELDGGNKFSGSVKMKVLTAFGAAIDSTFGNPDHGSKNYGMGSNKGEIPLQIRTIDQLQYLGEMSTTAGTSYTEIEYFGIKHDITGRKLEGEYKPYTVNVDWINGFGYRIMDLNIEPATGDAALFSSVTKGGKIENIILYSTDGKGRITSKDGNAAGILATTSKGSVTNCVVSGYTISGKNYVGGIIGEISDNRIPVINCQVIVTLDGMNSAKGIGGIAGYAQAKFAPNNKGEQGKIESCYAGGKIVNATSSTKVGGIFGEQKEMDNNPVTGCYSYMDLRDPTNNGTKYAIGQPNNNNNNIADTCYYLTEYATGATVDTTQGTGQTFEQLCNQRTDDTKKADYVYVPNGTDTIDGITSWDDGAYPMAAVVKVGVHAGVDTGVAETGDVLVHYGDWPYCARAAGIAYWEKVGTEYIFKAVWVDHSGNIQEYTKDEYDDLFCDDHHVDATGKITEHKIDDSGYVFFTSSKDMTISAPGTGSGSSREEAYEGVYGTTSDANVISALEKKLNVTCLSDTKVYSNKVFKNASKTGVVDAECTVTVTGSTTEKTLYCNPGMSGVAEKSFADTYKTIEEPGGTKREVVDVASDLEIEIRTVEQLDNIPDNVAKGLHFKQTHDIYGGDYTSNKYTGAVSFAGTYDGQSYKILDLEMQGADKNVGLFASVNANTCELRNIIMYAPNGATISGTGTKGPTASSDHFGVGGLVGSISNGSSARAKIENCVVAGYTITGQQYVGGIVGWGFYGADIKNCAAVNDIVCATIEYVKEGSNLNFANNSGAGGILGGYGSNTANKTQITNCYVGGTIKVTGEGASYAIVGGIVGLDGNTGSNHAIVQNCYIYADMSECRTAGNVYMIDVNYDSSDKNNYYLDDSNRYPAGCELQGTPISYDDLTDSSKWNEKFPNIVGTEAPDTATSSYVTKNKSAGGTTSGDGMTAQGSGSNFPFPEMVQNFTGYNGDGNPQYDGFVHYGEWPVKNTTTTPNKNPGKIGVFMGFNDSSGGTFGSNSDAVAYMFDEHGMRYRLGTSSKSRTCSYLGLVIGGNEPTGVLQVIYFADGVTNDGGDLTGKVTSCYTYDKTSATSVTSANADVFGSYKLYQVHNDTINTDTGAVVIALDANVSGTTGTTEQTIEANRVVGWFKLKELNDTKGKTPYTGISIPKGASLNGVMSAAVPEGLMPEVLALQVNELAGEPVVEGETEEILPPDAPEEVMPEASALPVNELAGEPVEEGETEEILPPDAPEEVTPEASALPENELAGETVAEEETGEILPPDTPDAIKPEEFTLPDPENTDDNGDDGHTEIIDIRMSVARVRRVR